MSSEEQLEMLTPAMIIGREQARLHRLMSDKDHRAVAECAARIEYAARKLGFLCNDQIFKVPS